ncbi:hypothetical protein EON81_13705 [bacterium]|nr:MAG: hypothetical protein EON81_13705 [bacterium]
MPVTERMRLFAGDGDLALTPGGGGTAAPANSLILSVTGITLAGGISVGTAKAYSAPPAGRSVLPL